MSQNSGRIKSKVVMAENGETAPLSVRHPKQTSSCKTCILVTLLVVIVLVIVGVILAVTVFKTKDPRTELISASLEGITPRVTLPAIRIQLNITLNLTFSVHNPNHVTFQSEDGNSALMYRGYQVGEADVNPGIIRARKTSNITCQLTVEIDRLGNSGLTPLIEDIMGGQLIFEANTRIPGKVKILGIKKHVTAVSDCQFVIEVSDFKIKSQTCKNRVKL